MSKYIMGGVWEGFYPTATTRRVTEGLPKTRYGSPWRGFFIRINLSGVGRLLLQADTRRMAVVDPQLPLNMEARNARL